MQVEGVAESSGEQQDVVRDGWAGVFPVSPTGADTFRAGPRRSAPERSFGGAVVAQSLLAAGATVAPDRPAHSLHAYFLRAGEASAPIDFHVHRVRDGGSYSTRRVTAEQSGRAILELTASFQVAETGFTHQVPQLAAPEPKSLPTAQEAAADVQGALGEWFAQLPRRHPFDIRFDGELPRVAASRGEAAPPRQRFWMRSLEPLPDEPLVHAAALAYASDMLMLSTSLAPHARAVGAADVAAASLDHAVWLHRPVRADEWLCFEQESSWAAGGRCHCSGRLFDRAGRLVMTVAQEGMVRPLGPR
ncbi:acyl-CoA thioesterase [Blastococcus goldschmidtiae]|uniref:Thioesterase family protein n=1 Tax=Blastococcus goldschmidtiae TaxID=3075546 RepID=A0ABU2K4W2_9ACTN|nr:acyl-CoA thioesterase domain-containing protein [Blastococcus sp. DSM 46792]MDT0275239.1 thioesterase family protein [Blastococcus sp. DSM 46792]